MSEGDICPGCKKPVGTGTLLDEFPESPATNTTLHRLYMTLVLVDDEISIEEIVSRTNADITKTAWETFASRYRCLLCKSAMDAEAAYRLLEGADE